MLMPIRREVLYKDSVLPILILSQELAESIKPEVPYAIISITSPSCYEARLAKSPNRKAVLRLSFLDVDREERQAITDTGSRCYPQVYCTILCWNECYCVGDLSGTAFAWRLSRRSWEQRQVYQ